VKFSVHDSLNTLHIFIVWDAAFQCQSKQDPGSPLNIAASNDNNWPLKAILMNATNFTDK
jgi:hypothetical protein